MSLIGENTLIVLSKDKCKETCKICVLEKNISKEWHEEFKKEFQKEYFIKIKQHLHKKGEFYPEVINIFSFTHYTSFKDIKVVILGQDPYHNPGQAMGLAFSVAKKCKIPKSLQNIHKEVKANYKESKFEDGCLIYWALQGTLLLNTVLTVDHKKPGSHKKIGWELFVKEIINKINERGNVVFMLWGNHAQKYAGYITNKNNFVLKSTHPSPFSARKGFLGCKHFKLANDYLTEIGRGFIKW